jgi:hypothetical protein
MKKETERVLRKETKSDIKKLSGTGFEELSSKDTWSLYHVGTRQGAIVLGAGTKWCIAAEGANMFNHYSQSNIHFYILVNNAEVDDTSEDFRKIAIALNHDMPGKHAIFNVKDTKFPYSDLGLLIDRDIATWADKEVQSDYSKRPDTWQYTILQESTPKDKIKSLWNKHNRELTGYDLSIREQIIQRHSDLFSDVVSLVKQARGARDEAEMLRLTREHEPLVDDILAQTGTTKVLEELMKAKSISSNVLYKIASNNAATPEILARILKKTNDQSVWGMVAHRQETPLSSIELIIDKARKISTIDIIARRSDLTPDLYEKLLDQAHKIPDSRGRLEIE